VRVAVLFDDVRSRPNATLDEVGVLEAVAAVTDALTLSGHRPLSTPCGPGLGGLTRRLAEEKVDLVFNLCEGLGGESEGEIVVARTVEETGIPMTGCPAPVLALARRKDRLNTLLASRGLPVPPWALWDGEDPKGFSSAWRSFPAIVKPAGEDGSVGIDQASVVEGARALARRLTESRARRPLIVQEFVGTREISAAIVDGVVLPLSEISFSGLAEGHRPIVDYDAKWVPGSPGDLATHSVCPALLPGDLATLIRQLALRAWWVLGGAGYGRVDFRLAPPGSVYILEVNPNPDLSPDAGLYRSAQLQGWDYPTLVERIIRDALRRAKAPA